jgi:cytochrome c oxidase subunit IV
MTLQRIKMTVSAVWVLIAMLIAIAVDMSWTRGALVAGLGLLPPLAILLLWNEPTKTMSESIHDARD